jgi:hypothetical protein
MFEEERAHLQPLPVTGMQYFTQERRTVCDDSCVRVDHCSYAPAPNGPARWCCRKRSVCSTRRARRGASWPKRRRSAPTPNGYARLMFAVGGSVGQRKLWGIVSLADCYPRRLVDRACAQALADGVHSYKHVKVLTEKLVAEALARLDQADMPAQAELTR